MLLVPLLDGQVYAVDLPGRGARPADVSTVTVADLVDAVVSEILQIVDVDAGHMAMISRPVELARVLNQLSAEA